jgi:hypothetical protein
MATGKEFTTYVPALDEMEAEVLKDYCLEFGIESEWGYDNFGITLFLKYTSELKKYVPFARYLAKKHIKQQNAIIALYKKNSYCATCPHGAICEYEVQHCVVD